MEVMEDVQELIVERLRAGVKARKIAREYGLTYAYVLGLAKEHGIKLVRGCAVGAFYERSPDTLIGSAGLMLSDVQERRAAIVDELKRNDNLADIGWMFGVSRERVRQIGMQEGIYRSKSKSFLRSQNLELLKPLLEHVATGLCNRCGENPIVSKHLFMCDRCWDRHRMAGNVISRLRDYIKWGKTLHLNQAAWVVRKYGFTVEELRRY